MSEPVPAIPRFADLHLPDFLQAALDRRGYTTPTPIQAEIIPHVLAGRDVVGQAQTGTGKTAAFALPLLARIEPALAQTQVLVLAPTRELAAQVAEACSEYGADLPGLRIAAIYGGASYGEQLRQLRGAQIIVATPGRLMDHMRSGKIDLKDIRCLVLDEADEMLRMGFIDDVEWILAHTPSSRQVALFSATMPREIRSIADKYLNDPVTIAIASREATATTVRQRYWLVRGLRKAEALARIIEGEDTDGVMVFTRTKLATLEVAEELQQHDLQAAALNGDMPQNQRERVVEKLKSGELDVVIATDVAARGLDVSRISHVVNYDLPTEAETYVHRIGRTGRAGRSGEAISFVHPRERRLLQTIERRNRQHLEAMELPSAQAINERRRARFAARIRAACGQDCSEFRPLVDELLAELASENREPSELCAALARLVHGNRPFLVTRDPPRAPAPELSRGRDAEIAYYRLDVGARHGAVPGRIVGAITGELNLPGRSIGHIQIHDSYCTVGLPADLPARLLSQLQRVRVCGRPLAATQIEQPPPVPRRSPRPPPRPRHDTRPPPRRRREG